MDANYPEDGRDYTPDEIWEHEEPIGEYEEQDNDDVSLS